MIEHRITLQEQIEHMRDMITVLELQYAVAITEPAIEQDLAQKRAILRTLEALVSDGK